jgi:hypothetical protein
MRWKLPRHLRVLNERKTPISSSGLPTKEEDWLLYLLLMEQSFLTDERRSLPSGADVANLVPFHSQGLGVDITIIIMDEADQILLNELGQLGL